MSESPAARWQRVRATFDAIADLPGEAWDAALARATHDDAALGAEVRRLLDASRADYFHLDAPRLALGDSQEDEARIGLTVARYRLVRLVGCGGMGAVYEGVRADGEYQQRVAVKLIRPQLGGFGMAARFRRERQILAALEHPNIARLLDGGATDAGEPFFVMEFVEGTPITTYCTANRLTIRERLALFVEVCTAVGHAHSKLIVHRDLKPANILVSADAGVKLLDFGVAQLLGDRGPAAGEETAPARSAAAAPRALTLEYASPEQLRDEPASVASDVYSLGVVLYELLSGARPLRLRTRSPAAALQALHAAPRPASEGATAVTATAMREPSLARLRRRLAGELDDIVGTAMSVDTDRRYVSVEQLADDVRRWLGGLPVLAHAGGAGYRARRFVRRHWRSVAALSVAVVALLVGAGATAVQARRAETERAKSARINAFLQDMLSAPDTRWYRSRSAPSGAQVTVSEVLDDAARRVGTDFAREPAVEAAVRQTLGRTYHLMSRYDEARVQLTRALEIDRRLGVAPVPDLVADLRDLGLSELGRGDPRAADTLFVAALALCRTHGERADTAHVCAHSLNHLGLARWEEDDLASADRLLQQTLTIARQAFGVRHPAVAIVLAERAGVRAAMGDLQGGERMYRESLAIFAEHRGREYGERASTLGGLALLLENDDRLEEAETLLRDEVDVIERAEGPAHPDAGLNWVHLGAIHRRLGQLSLAREETARGEALLVTTMSDRQRYFPKIKTYEGLLLLASHEPERAEQVLRVALAAAVAKYAPHDPRLAEVQDALGLALLARGRTRDAIPLFAASAATFAQRLGPSNRQAIHAAEHLESARVSPTLAMRGP